MASNPAPPDRDGAPPDWRVAGLRYHDYKFFLHKRFGGPVWRVSVDGGLTCPNVDGQLGQGGCVFCDNRSFSPSRRGAGGSIRDQLDEGIRRLQRRHPDCERFLAYFQPATNTYAPVAHLETLYRQALDHPQVIGLVIGTRPDCVPDQVLDLLTELARHTYVAVEYGMQTAHDRTLDWMNRGHHHEAMRDAVRRSRGRALELGAHIVLGFPGESRADMLLTARELARLDLDAVKLHNLYAVQGTRLADQVRRREVRLMERDQYVAMVADVLEQLPERMVIQRISGDAPARFLVAPAWCADKGAVRRALEAELQCRDSWQGRLHGQPLPPSSLPAGPLEPRRQ